jgi:hypothetical protein
LTGLPLTTGVTGTLPTANGGTNLTSFTSGGVVYASSTSALATGSVLTFNGTNFTAPRTQFTTSGSPPASGAGLEIIGGTSPLLFAYNRGTSAYLPLNATASAFGWSISGSDAMTLTSTGLGVGTSSPTYKVDVSVTGNNGIRTTSSAGQQLYLGNTGGDAVVGTLNNYSLGFLTNGSVRATLDTLGNLGIGTSSPTQKLDVYGTGMKVNNASYVGYLGAGNTFAGGAASRRSNGNSTAAIVSRCRGARLGGHAAMRGLCSRLVAAAFA